MLYQSEPDNVFLWLYDMEVNGYDDMFMIKMMNITDSTIIKLYIQPHQSSVLSGIALASLLDDVTRIDRPRHNFDLL